LFLAFLLAAAALAGAQGDDKVVTVTNGGTVSGSVKWSGPAPRILDFPVTKDPQLCDPDSRKTVDRERRIIGPQGGVANTVVYLKNIPAERLWKRLSNAGTWTQRHCHYLPHILLVPESAALQMQSSDATLHTIHREGAATFNLPFPFPNQVISRTMSSPGWFICAATAVMSG
jgi:hypothetical protein